MKSANKSTVTVIAAIVHSVGIAIVVIFQLALAAGVPWGDYAMGGRFSGSYPVYMRGVAVLVAIVLLWLGAIVLKRARSIDLPFVPDNNLAIWAIVILFSVGTLLNGITPSAGERQIWLPVATILMSSSAIVALTTE